MKVIPSEYYICNYCKKNLGENPNVIKYVDDSGCNNKVYDMCSDDCLKIHFKYLKDSGDIKFEKVVEYINDYFSFNTNKTAIILIAYEVFL